MSKVNEKRFLVQYELCERKCGLNGGVCCSKPKCNDYECRYVCK